MEEATNRAKTMSLETKIENENVVQGEMNKIGEVKTCDRRKNAEGNCVNSDLNGALNESNVKCSKSESLEIVDAGKSKDESVDVLNNLNPDANKLQIVEAAAKENDSENNEVNAVSVSNEIDFFPKQSNATATKASGSEISESDVQSTCSTGNLNESRESIFCSDQSSESNVNGAAILTNVDNQSLCNLLIYTTEDSESDSSTSDESDGYESPYETLEQEVKQMQNASNSTSEKKTEVSKTTRALGEMSLEDLPPVPNPRNIKVEVQEKDCLQMGIISSIIDEIVMVESLPNMPAYDQDTLLFLDKGKQPLGYIFDVIGPVSQPLYAIRFNNEQEIQALNVSKGLPVFSAPKTEHTQYVFVQELMKIKGSDASWKDDVEVPEEFADFSDDEEEINAKHRTKIGQKSKKRNSLESHQSFEKDMNVRNLIDTRLHKIRDTYEPVNKKYVPSQANYKKSFQFCTNVRPNFAYSIQPNGSTSVPSFAQLPQVSGMFNVPPPQFARPNIPMPHFTNLPPNVATFVPHIPPPMLHPPPPQYRPGLPQMQGRSVVPEQMPPRTLFQNFPPPPPGVDVVGPSKQSDTRQPPPMIFPPNLGLPRPQAQALTPLTTHNNTTVGPNIPFYRPPHMQQQTGWYNFQNPIPVPPSSHPQHTRQYTNGGMNYYSHKRL